MTASSFLRKGERQLNCETTDEQTERVTVKRIKIDDEAIALDVIRRAENRFVFEIMRDSTLVAIFNMTLARRLALPLIGLSAAALLICALQYWVFGSSADGQPAQQGPANRSGSGQSSLP